jgi:hypothetical protein
MIYAVNQILTEQPTSSTDRVTQVERTAGRLHHNEHKALRLHCTHYTNLIILSLRIVSIVINEKHHLCILYTMQNLWTAQFSGGLASE